MPFDALLLRDPYCDAYSILLPRRRGYTRPSVARRRTALMSEDKLSDNAQEKALKCKLRAECGTL